MEKFREQLAQIFNENTLPFECKYYVLKDIFNEVREVYRNMLEQYSNQKEEGEKKSDE